MDDTLLASDNNTLLHKCVQFLIGSVTTLCLLVALEKNTTTAPWGYLGYKLMSHTFTPQQIAIHFLSPLPLSSLQQFLRHINWLRPIFGIPTYQLTSLSNFLQGDPNPVAMWSVMLETEQLDLLSQEITSASFDRRHLSTPITFLVLKYASFPYGGNLPGAA